MLHSLVYLGQEWQPGSATVHSTTRNIAVNEAAARLAKSLVVPLMFQKEHQGPALFSDFDNVPGLRPPLAQVRPTQYATDDSPSLASVHVGLGYECWRDWLIAVLVTMGNPKGSNRGPVQKYYAAKV